jgi:metallo-beta-lactamase family protein
VSASLTFLGAAGPVLVTDALSAHADQAELLRWLRGFRRPPATTWCVHGEPEALDGLCAAIPARLGWPAGVAAHGASAPI